MLYSVLKNILFRLQPENAHKVVMHGAKVAHKYFPFYKRILPGASAARNPALARTFCCVTFKNPVGLAAGFDKNGSYIEALDGMGFGFIEVGTVTPKPQPGNPAPRLFRLPADNALINRMGFNNMGVNVLAARLTHLRKKRPDIIVGGNIGKNKLTPNEFAVNDYLQCFNALYTLVDYFVVNVSSPNTPGLRELQDRGPLTEILNAVQSLKATLGAKQPVLLKIAPDLTEHQLNDIVEIVKETNIEGIIATNTTISRSGLKTTDARLVEQAGGVSGRPLKARSLHVVEYLRRKAGNQLFIIGVGGIESGNDAINMLNAGADLVQLYTGFIYKGPGLPGQICQAILAHKNASK